MELPPRDEWVPLTEVSKLLPRGPWGRRVHVSTVTRWSSRGVAGAVLRTERIGRTRYTTGKWLREFFDHLNGRHGGDNSPEKPDRPQGNTEAELDQHGL